MKKKSATPENSKMDLVFKSAKSVLNLFKCFVLLSFCFQFCFQFCICTSVNKLAKMQTLNLSELLAILLRYFKMNQYVRRQKKSIPVLLAITLD